MTMNPKRLFASLVLVLAMASPLHAVMDTVDNVPAATLLQPYFEVSYLNANGPRTVLTIGNVSGSERLAHVTLWTDRGVPAYSFDVRLDAAGAKEIDLTALFRSGTLPQSTAGGFGSCSGFLPAAALNATQLNDLRRAFRGQSSALFGGECGGVNYNQDVARGYATIDATSACTTLFPNQGGYFVSGGLGIATNDNILWGESYTSETSTETAYGSTMVHIEAALTPLTDGVPGPPAACSSYPCPPNPFTPLEDYTFYSRVNGNTADNREGLPQEWWGRYDVDEQATFARVWRDPGSVDSFTCGAPPAGLGTAEILSFDDRENPALGASPVAPYATQQIALSGANILGPGKPRGTIRYNLALKSGSGALGIRNQSFVSHVYQSGTRRSESPAIAGNYPASSTPPFILYGTAAPACSDGIDNDGDGFIDFPADPGCKYADANVENPMCNDGDDNDGDGQIDFPADSDCHSASDWYEIDGYNPLCDDGIDNDGDGKIDFPADGGCFAPNDSTEDSNACSDGIDNDGDGKIDFPADPGCASPNASTESPLCNDGIDNDGDGKIDFPADPGCASAASTTEAPQCNDGISNDADGLIDYPADPGCASPSSNNESPQCNNGTDNDGDGLIDMDDPGCSSPSDPQEFETQCSDGLDNDHNGFIDFPNDPSCISPSDNSEIASCSDGEDNDCDGLSDDQDPGCASGLDPTEFPGLNPQCSDGIDNDGDGYFDYPADPGCESRADDIEYTPGQEPAVAAAAIPSLSTWGLMLMAALLGVVAMVSLRGSMNG